MTLKRHDNWPHLLAQFIEARWGAPMVWGSNDCCIFAADWIKLCTGEDLAKDLRGRYTNEVGAMLCASHAGIATPEDPYGVLRWPEVLGLLSTISPSMARRGDVVAARSSGGLSLGVSVGFAAAVPAASRLAFLPFEQIVAAWRI